MPRDPEPTDDDLTALLEPYVAPTSMANVREVIRRLVRAARGACEQCGAARSPIDGPVCQLCLLANEAVALGLYDIEVNPLAD